MRLDADSMFIFLHNLGVNLQEESTIKILLETYLQFGDNFGNDSVVGMKNLYYLLDRLKVNIEDKNITQLINESLIESSSYTNNIPTISTINKTLKYVSECMYTTRFDPQLLLAYILEDFGIPINQNNYNCLTETILCILDEKELILENGVHTFLSQKLGISNNKIANIYSKTVFRLNKKYIMTDFSREINKMIFATKMDTPNHIVSTILSITNYIQNVEKCIKYKCHYSSLSIKQKNLFEMEQLIIKTLHEVGINSSYLGYICLKEALLYLYTQEEVFGLTTDLYPAVAKILKTSASSVERNIRTSIKVAKEATPTNNSLARSYVFSPEYPSTNQNILLRIHQYLTNAQKDDITNMQVLPYSYLYYVVVRLNYYAQSNTLVQDSKQEIYQNDDLYNLQLVTRILYYLQIYPDVLSFHYLRDILLFSLSTVEFSWNENILSLLSKKYNTTKDNIIRLIQFSISKSISHLDQMADSRFADIANELTRMGPNISRYDFVKIICDFVKQEGKKNRVRAREKRQNLPQIY